MTEWLKYQKSNFNLLGKFGFINSIGLFLLILLNPLYLAGQCGQYVIYELEKTGERYQPFRIQEGEGGYYWNLFGEHMNYPHTQNRIIKIDTDLNLLWETTLKDVPGSLSGSLLYFPGDVLLFKEKGFVLSGSRDSLTQLRGFLVNEVNLANGQIDTTYKFDFNVGTEDIYNSIYGGILVPDSSGYLFSGFYQIDTNYLLVMKADFSGAVQWFKTYPISTFGKLFSKKPMITLPKGDYLMLVTFGSLAQQFDYLVRLDSAGQLLSKTSGPFVEEGVDIALHPNGNIVYFSKPPHAIPTTDTTGLRLSMLTPDLDILWTRSYYTFEYPYNLAYGAGFGHNLSIAPDGRILMVGESGSTMHLICYSPDGDLLWTRVVYLLPESGPKGIPILTDFGDAIWTSDGCILASGVYHWGFEYQHRPFLLKLDSLGCLEPGCDENIILNTNQPSVALEEDCWKVYPNPFQRPIHLTLDPTCPLAAVINQIVVTDILGREVYRQSISSTGSDLEIYLPSLATGMLILRLQAGPVILGQRSILRLE